MVGDARSVMGPRLAPRRRAGMEAAGLPFDGGEQGSESGRTGCNNRVGWVEELALWPGGLVLPEGRDEMIIGMISEGREIRHLETKRFILASSSESKNRRVEQSSSRAAEKPTAGCRCCAAAGFELASFAYKCDVVSTIPRPP